MRSTFGRGSLEFRGIEPGEHDLRQLRIGEGIVRIGQLDAVVQRRQGWRPVAIIEEARRSGKEQVSERKAPVIDRIHQLAQRAQALLALGAAQALDRFDLVEGNRQAGDTLPCARSG